MRAFLFYASLEKVVILELVVVIKINERPLLSYTVLFQLAALSKPDLFLVPIKHFFPKKSNIKKIHLRIKMKIWQ